jgi:hypothetical protein
MREQFSLRFDGGLASDGQLDFYDAASSQEGFARLLAVTGHFAATGRVIHKAPYSEADVRIEAPRRGSFLISVAVVVGTAVISGGVGAVVAHLLNRSLPRHDPQMQAVHKEMKEANRLKRIELGLEPRGWAQIVEEERLLADRDEEIQTLRGILAVSMAKTFRPLGRSADTCAIGVGRAADPIRVMDAQMAARIIADEVDKEFVATTGVVNNFSQSQQTGFLWDDLLGRRIPFECDGEKLPAGNDFSWSLFEQKPVAVRGRYVRWVDGSVKKILIRSSERIKHDERFNQ